MTSYTIYTTQNSALLQGYLAAQSAQQSSTFWLRIRQAFYILSIIALFGWAMWMDRTVPGGVWRMSMLTSVASHPSPFPGLMQAPENDAPLFAFFCALLPSLFAIKQTIVRMVKRGWTHGGIWVACMLAAVPMVAGLIVHLAN